MTQTNPFLSILQNKQPVPDPRKPVLDVLTEFCDAISQYASGKLTCKLVPGYPTNYGQEYRVVISSIRTGYEHSLLRAYIPTSGSQMKVDYYDYQLVEYPGVDDLKTGLTMFLAKPEAQDAIDAYARA